MSMHSGKNGILLQKNFAEEKVKLNKTHRNILENMHKYLQIQNKNEQIAHDCPAEHCHRSLVPFSPLLRSHSINLAYTGSYGPL